MASDAEKYIVKIMPNAVAQLNEINGYIVTKLNAPMAAKRLNKNLLEAINFLSIFPNRGSVVRTQMWNDKGIRFIIVGNYDIYYRVVAEKMEIHVLVIAYSRRDLKNVLGVESSNYCVSEIRSRGY